MLRRTLRRACPWQPAAGDMRGNTGRAGSVAAPRRIMLEILSNMNSQDRGGKGAADPSLIGLQIDIFVALSASSKPRLAFTKLLFDLRHAGISCWMI
jgi:hypothetical protein